jgi:hypothetical protein
VRLGPYPLLLLFGWGLLLRWAPGLPAFLLAGGSQNLCDRRQLGQLYPLDDRPEASSLPYLLALWLHQLRGYLLFNWERPEGFPEAPLSLRARRQLGLELAEGWGGDRGLRGLALRGGLEVALLAFLLLGGATLLLGGGAAGTGGAKPEADHSTPPAAEASGANRTRSAAAQPETALQLWSQKATTVVTETGSEAQDRMLAKALAETETETRIRTLIRDRARAWAQDRANAAAAAAREAQEARGALAAWPKPKDPILQSCRLLPEPKPREGLCGIYGPVHQPNPTGGPVPKFPEPTVEYYDESSETLELRKQLLIPAPSGNLGGPLRSKTLSAEPPVASAIPEPAQTTPELLEARREAVKQRTQQVLELRKVVTKNQSPELLGEYRQLRWLLAQEIRAETELELRLQRRQRVPPTSTQLENLTISAEWLRELTPDPLRERYALLRQQLPDLREVWQTRETQLS